MHSRDDEEIDNLNKRRKNKKSKKKGKKRNEETERYEQQSEYPAIPSIIYKYVPDESIYFFDPDSEHPERLIFDIEGPYLDFEEEHMTKLQTYIDKSKEKESINEFFDRGEKLRFLQGNHYKYEKTVENMIDHIDYINNKFPKELSSEALKILEEGLFYTYGRDKHFRLILIFQEAVMVGSDHSEDECINATFYACKYFMDNLLVPGKVENWLVIHDLANLSMTKIPIKFSIRFLKLAQAHNKCRGYKVVALNVTFALRAIWRILSPFVDEKIKIKIQMTKDNTHPVINELVHPSQLEKKYGGEAENLTLYWPPRFDSIEFGHDPSMIREDSPENLSTLANHHRIEEHMGDMNLSPKSSLFCSHNDQSISNHNFKRNINNREIDSINAVHVDNIHLTERSQHCNDIKLNSTQKKVNVTKNNKGCCCVF